MPSLRSFFVNHGLPGLGLRLTTEQVFFPGDIKHEIRRRGLKPDHVTVLGCSVCQASAVAPVEVFFGHLGDCPASHNPALLAFQTKDGREHWPPRPLMLEWLNRDDDEPDFAPAPAPGYLKW